MSPKHFLTLLTDIWNSARLPRTVAKNEYTGKNRRPCFPWLGGTFDCKTNIEIVELHLINVIHPLRPFAVYKSEKKSKPNILQG